MRNLSDPPPRIPSQHFVFLDALRGLAALWVVLFHIKASKFVPHLSAALPGWIVGPVFDWGQYGVLIFFVLSGFVIAHSLHNVNWSHQAVQRFLVRRWVRLTPPYYGAIALFLTLSAYQFFRGWTGFALFEGPHPFGRWVAHLFYLQEFLKLKSYDDIYWTLCLEMQFYAIFALLLWVSHSLDSHSLDSHSLEHGQTLGRSLPRARAWVFGAWTLFGAAYNLGYLPFPYDGAVFLGFQYSFLLGVYAYWAWQQQLHWAWVWGYAAFVALTAPVNQAFALTSALGAVALWAIAQAGMLSVWLRQPIFQFLGKISYSLYLTHVSVQGLVFSLWLGRHGQTLTQECVGLVVTLGVCLGVATVFWFGFEWPSIRLSQRLKSKSVVHSSS